MTSSDTAHRIPVTYSRTLFELALQQQLVEAVKNDLNIVENLTKAEKSFLAFMTSPYFSLEQKQLLIEKVFGSVLSDLTSNFLMVAESHNRISSLSCIIAEYNRLYENYHNYLNIHVTVSQALGQNKIETLKAALSRAMANDKIILEVATDPSIIGGVIIRYNDMVIDNSVRSRLHRAVDTIIKRSSEKT